MLGIRRIDRVPNPQIREFCGLKKSLDESIDEGVLQWFRNLERDRTAKRVYIGECASSRLVGRLKKRWIDTVKECFKKRCLNVTQARRMVQDRSEWWGFVRGNPWGIAQG